MIRLIIGSAILILGFILGRCSRSTPPEVIHETVYIHDTIRLVDTVSVRDTVYVSSVGELRLIGCDTASFSWNFNTSHVFRMERGINMERSLKVQSERLSQVWAVGVGIGIWKDVFFPYISIRYKNLTGWIKPIRPLSGGVSFEFIKF